MKETTILNRVNGLEIMADAQRIRAAEMLKEQQNQSIRITDSVQTSNTNEAQIVKLIERLDSRVEGLEASYEQLDDIQGSMSAELDELDGVTDVMSAAVGEQKDQIAKLDGEQDGLHKDIKHLVERGDLVTSKLTGAFHRIAKLETRKPSMYLRFIGIDYAKGRSNAALDKANADLTRRNSQLWASNEDLRAAYEHMWGQNAALIKDKSPNSATVKQLTAYKDELAKRNGILVDFITDIGRRMIDQVSPAWGPIHAAKEQIEEWDEADS